MAIVYLAEHMSTDSEIARVTRSICRKVVPRLDQTKVNVNEKIIQEQAKVDSTERMWQESFHLQEKAHPDEDMFMQGT